MIDRMKKISRSDNAKVVLLPGNLNFLATGWIQELGTSLEQAGIPVYWRGWPDKIFAREHYWMSYLKETVRADAATILIGFSTGAVAAMRYAEQSKIHGSILVAPYYKDLGSPLERLSGYFDRPWHWESIRSNQEWIVQYSSTDDPYIPLEESRQLQTYLRSDYHEGPHKHFLQNHFPRLAETLTAKLLDLN